MRLKLINCEVLFREMCGARSSRRDPEAGGGYDAICAQPLVKLELHPRAGQTLADQLFAAGVEFPCGGESACGGCKVRVLEGEVPVTAAMRDALSEEELRDGWRLACCASAAERVVVEVEQWSLRVLTDEAPRAHRAARRAAARRSTWAPPRWWSRWWISRAAKCCAWRPRSTRRRATAPT